eukprot:2476861-Rhodomonas_salina.1
MELYRASTHTEIVLSLFEREPARGDVWNAWDQPASSRPLFPTRIPSLSQPENVTQNAETAPTCRVTFKAAAAAGRNTMTYKTESVDSNFTSISRYSVTGVQTRRARVSDLIGLSSSCCNRQVASGTRGPLLLYLLSLCGLRLSAAMSARQSADRDCDRGRTHPHSKPWPETKAREPQPSTL